MAKVNNTVLYLKVDKRIDHFFCLFKNFYFFIEVYLMRVDLKSSHCKKKIVTICGEGC